MPNRLAVFTAAFALVAFAACATPTDPSAPYRPSLDVDGCDTIYVHPDSVPDPNEFKDEDGCHVVLPWVDLRL